MSAEVVQICIRSFYGLGLEVFRVRSRSTAPAPIRRSPLSTAPPRSRPVFGSEGLEPVSLLPVPELVPVAPEEDPGLPDEPVVAPAPEDVPLVELPEPELPEPEPLEPELPELGVEVLVEASTTIVPFMNGWIEQMYANVPDLVNVCEAL